MKITIYHDNNVFDRLINLGIETNYLDLITRIETRATSLVELEDDLEPDGFGQPLDTVLSWFSSAKELTRCGFILGRSCDKTLAIYKEITVMGAGDCVLCGGETDWHDGDYHEGGYDDEPYYTNNIYKCQECQQTQTKE